MKKIEFLKEADIEELVDSIPESPCVSCDGRASESCFTCELYLGYERKIYPWKYHGIHETALKVKEIKELENKINEFIQRRDYLVDDLNKRNTTSEGVILMEIVDKINKM